MEAAYQQKNAVLSQKVQLMEQQINDYRERENSLKGSYKTLLGMMNNPSEKNTTIILDLLGKAPFSEFCGMSNFDERDVSEIRTEIGSNYLNNLPGNDLKRKLEELITQSVVNEAKMKRARTVIDKNGLRNSKNQIRNSETKGDQSATHKKSPRSIYNGNTVKQPLSVSEALNTPQKPNLEGFAVLRSSKSSNDLQRDLKPAHHDKENCRFPFPLDQSADSPLHYLPHRNFTGTPGLPNPNPTQENVTPLLRGPNPNPNIQSPYNTSPSPAPYQNWDSINKCLKAHNIDSAKGQEIQTLREKNLQLVNKIEMVESERQSNMRTSSNVKDIRNGRRLCMGLGEVGGLEDLTALDLNYDSVLNLYRRDTPSARGFVGLFCGSDSKGSVGSDRSTGLRHGLGDAI